MDTSAVKTGTTWQHHREPRTVRVVAVEGERVRIERIRDGMSYFPDDRTSTVRMDRWHATFREVE